MQRRKILVGILFIVILSSCGGGGSSSGADENVANIAGLWKGGVSGIDFRCAGGLEMDFQQSGASLSGTSTADIIGFDCGPRQLVKNSFTGSINGNDIKLVDDDGDNWTLTLTEDDRIDGTLVSSGAGVRFEVFARRE